MVKFTILLKRKPSLTQEQFVDHHRNVHAALFTSVPVVEQTVRRYIQQHALPVEFPGMPPARYDGITELWFDDVEAIGRLFSDAEYLRVVRPDEASFTGAAPRPMRWARARTSARAASSAASSSGCGCGCGGAI